MVDPISRRQAITYGLGAVAAGALANGQRAAGLTRLARGSGGARRDRGNLFRNQQSIPPLRG